MTETSWTTDRMTVGGGDELFAAIRRLDVTVPAGVGRCSSTMITFNIGLTAAHCFADNSGDTEATGILSRHMTVPSGDVRSISLIAINVAYRTNQDTRNDWAMFKLDSAMSSVGDGNLFMDSTDDEDGGEIVSNVGMDGTTLLPMQHAGCQISSASTEKRLSYDCDTTDGHSGGPVYRKFTSGGVDTRLLVATHADDWFPNNRGSRVAFWRPTLITTNIALADGTGETIP